MSSTGLDLQRQAKLCREIYPSLHNPYPWGMIANGELSSVGRPSFELTV